MNLNLIQKISNLFFVGLTVVVCVVFPVSVHAQYRTERVDVNNALYKDFVVGPGKIELEINPGESKTATIKVTNRTGSTRNFRLEVEDFTGSRDPSASVVLLGDQRGPYSLKDFLHFEATTFELENGEQAFVPVRVTLPTDVEPGGRYGSVLVSTTAKEGATGQSSAIVSRIGTLFFVRVPGDVKEEGRLSGFQTLNAQKFFGSGPITFRLLYENNGSVYLNPYGEVRIKNIIGQEVGVVEVDPWFSLPQSLRVREVSWERAFLFGRYTAVASINRGYDNVIDTEVLTFWVLPWKILVPGFLVILLLVLALRVIITRFEIKRK